MITTGALLLWLLQAVITVPANTPFNLVWEPLADTVSFRIIINGEQIGSDIPREFQQAARFTYGPAPNGQYAISVLSVNAAGVTTPTVFRVDGQVAPTPVRPPTPQNLRLLDNPT